MIIFKVSTVEEGQERFCNFCWKKIRVGGSVFEMLQDEEEFPILFLHGPNTPWGGCVQGLKVMFDAVVSKSVCSLDEYTLKRGVRSSTGPLNHDRQD